MNVLFLTIVSIDNLDEQSLYGDLLKTFRQHGHDVYAVTARERRKGSDTRLITSHGVTILKVATGNITKSKTLEKGIATLRVPRQFAKAIKTHLPNIRFDLIVYPTPPTTFYGLVGKLKRRHHAKTYLLLKDIFPQASVDLGALTKTGVKGPIYKYFKHTEKRTYLISDHIGCSTQGNVDYLIEHEPYLDKNIIEVNPNSLIPASESTFDRNEVLRKYELPSNEALFVYGGNLGIAQCIDFLVDCLKLNEKNPIGHFVIAGSGTDRAKLEQFFRAEKPLHATLLPMLGHRDFDELLSACDAGIVLLDPRFTVPNCPSRCLSYMQAFLPMVFATDDSCDFGITAEEHGFGLNGSSEDPREFMSLCAHIVRNDLNDMGRMGRDYFEKYCTAEITYETIMEHFDDQH